MSAKARDYSSRTFTYRGCVACWATSSSPIYLLWKEVCSVSCVSCTNNGDAVKKCCETAQRQRARRDYDEANGGRDCALGTKAEADARFPGLENEWTSPECREEEE